MRQRAAIFCHNGLGDGVNCLVLSQNLFLNGWEVDTYQNTVGSMQNWFPHLPVQPYPNLTALPSILSSYDLYLVVQNDTDPFVKTLIREGKERFPERIKVVYLYPSPHIMKELYYEDCFTDPEQSVADNLLIVCDKVLHLPIVVKDNGFRAPVSLIHQKYPKRIVVHPTSARVTRNWPKERFVKLALHLKKRGYELVFVPGTKEEAEWVDVKELGFGIGSFSNLDALASFIYESGYLIGNDSGLGHLASALNIPTLTFCRRKALAKMWAPSFCHGVAVTPSSWIPNIRGLRLRDRYWRKWISVKRALRGFDQLKMEAAGCGASIYSFHSKMAQENRI